jgi:predicted dehydrogenase
MPDAARRRWRGAIIGSGGIARAAHLPAFRQAPGVRDRVELVACVDADPAASSLDGLPLLDSLEQLAGLAGGPIDFIDICTPTATHLELALWGLERGYHVLCEKPVALTRAEASRLAGAARRHGRILAPCHQYRFNPVWRRIAAWLAEGAIGRWHLAELATYRLAADPGGAAGAATEATPWRGRAATSRGGVLLDHGSHLIYQILDVAGPPAAVHAWTARLRHPDYDVEDTASVTLEYADRVAVIFVTWAAARRDALIRFTGDRGMIELKGGELLLDAGGSVERHNVAAELQKAAYPTWFGGLFAEFVTALERPAPDGYLEDIDRVAQVLEDAYAAAGTAR